MLVEKSQVIPVTGCLPNQGNQGKIREMLVDLKISGKNQGNPLNLEKIREKSGKLFISKNEF